MSFDTEAKLHAEARSLQVSLCRVLALTGWVGSKTGIGIKCAKFDIDLENEYSRFEAKAKDIGRLGVINDVLGEPRWDIDVLRGAIGCKTASEQYPFDISRLSKEAKRQFFSKLKDKCICEELNLLITVNELTRELFEESEKLKARQSHLHRISPK